MVVAAAAEDQLVNHAQNVDINCSTTNNNNRIYLVTDGLRSKHTITAYRLAFNQFLRDGAKTTDLQVLLDYKPRTLEAMVIGYIENLRDKGKANRTILLHCAAIFHFFEMNDIILNKRKIMRFVPADESGRYGQDKAYTIDQISRILNEGCSDIRSKVIVLLMASTGMRLGALPQLRVGDLTFISEYSLYKIWVYAASKKEKYLTYCTPECAATINAYLIFRRGLGEIINDSSPLIREMFNVENPFTINAPKPSTERMMILALEQALLRTGVNQRTSNQLKKSRREIMRSHGFRKFWNTTMIKARVEPNARHSLIGHKSALGLDISYDKTEEVDRLAEYLKAIDLLTIDKSARLQTKVEKLEIERIEELDRIKGQLARVMAEKQEAAEGIKQLQAQISKLGKFVVRLNENRVGKGEILTMEDDDGRITTQRIKARDGKDLWKVFSNTKSDVIVTNLE